MAEEQYNEALKSIREYDGIPPIEDLIERPDIPLVPEMPCDSFPKPPSSGTMADPIISLIKLHGKIAEKRVKESMNAYPSEILKAVGEKIKEKGTNMTDLQATASAYASHTIRPFEEKSFEREAVFYLIRDAYKQGWVDRDTEDERPETQDECFNDAPDCRYFSDGDCTKGLPGTPCERRGCAAYYPKESEER